MTLLCIEGFEHFDYNDFDKKAGWTKNFTTGFVTGRFGGQAPRLASSSSNYMNYNLGVNKSTIYFGVAMKKAVGTTPTLSTSYPIFRFYDDSSVTQVRIMINESYGFNVYRDTTLIGASADAVFRNLIWQYIEGKITISATVGEVTLRVNETQVLNLTSQDTKNGSDYIRSMSFLCVNSHLDTRYDDIYIDDAQFHGDCRVRTFMPDSISTTNNDFTASAGNKDECVDETLLNEDTDYIVSDTLNHKQGFGITTGALGTVKGIQLNNATRLDEAGTRKITPLIRSNGADYSGTETDQIPSTYQIEHEIWETDPDDSGAWDQIKLEAAEFGLEITT
jgi:hypothetical protein